MEVIWKTVTVIINRRLGVDEALHDVIHGFQAGCGTGNASLEVKLLQQLTAMSELVLYTIYLDLHKR